ncbi:MAG: TIGR03088 family PEP-CTERM/XrtA system glycosyltransferase [Gammaproteobacteria bacterium]|nr:TIGR03088 family PEP-CTERM/XrtA system glycosyltransferase [Gammaproteobacteria bacterium]MCF6364469.1 TIGR03088 family PEP-CTERM/XrtA system glycosyltransferase [Gammaproteobacteria bacterium]
MTGETPGQPPLVVHVVHRLQMGGLENGLVNLINHTPAGRFRHAIVCMTDFTEFVDRISAENVTVKALHKQPGKDFGIYLRLFKIFRELQPDIVHTRNIGTLEAQVIARLCGVRGCIHGEHGRDMRDLDGSNRRHRLLRRLMSPLVNRYVALSRDTRQWLVCGNSVPSCKVVQLYNGVDTQRFRPYETTDVGNLGVASGLQGRFIVGTVGRLSAEKDQLTLVQAFLILIDRDPVYRNQLGLVLIGDGGLRELIEKFLQTRDDAVRRLVWMPGARSDVPEIMRQLDLFVLPSQTEGVSNTILEAMASAVPVLATAVGGNPELVVDGETGSLVEPCSPVAMADAIEHYLQNRAVVAEQGALGRKRVLAQFSIEGMVERYLALYSDVIGSAPQIKGRAVHDSE